MLDPTRLRDDPDALVNTVLELQKLARAMIADNALLKARLERELQHRYGPRSERGAHLPPGQGTLFQDPELPVSPLPSASPAPAPARLENARPAEPKGRNGRPAPRVARRRALR